MKKIISLLFILFIAMSAMAQTFTVQNLSVQGTTTLSPTPLGVTSGGTGASTAGGTALDNISGFSTTGVLTRTGSGAYAFNNVASCNTSSTALQWTGTALACNSSILANNVSGIVAILNGGTGLTSLGTGVQTGLNTNLNATNGFAGTNFLQTTGGGTTPQNWGAAGNGSTDDTAALQAWVNGAAANGQVAFCSNGTYKVTGTINLTSQAVKIAGPGGTYCAITPSMPVGPTVSGAAAGATYNPGASPSIRLTVSSTTNIGKAIDVYGVTGTTEANGGWPAVVIDSTHVDIVGPTFVHAWVSGGQIAFPVFAVVPATSPNSATQPQLDLSGVYFATPTANAASTDAIIITGGAFNSPGSNVDIYNNVINGYHRGMVFWQSFSDKISYNFVYNCLAAGIMAIQDGSFSNVHLEYNQLFSNGNTNQESAITMGGSFLVETPNVIGNQASGNWNGLNLNGNVQGGQFIGNYLENNNVGVGFNLGCNGTNNIGNQFIGNWLFYASGTNVTNLASCTGSFWSGNFQTDNTFTMANNTVVPTTNILSGTAAINYPTTMPSSVVSSTVSAQAITSNVALGVTSVSLSPGNWSCSGSTLTHPAASTVQTLNVLGLNNGGAFFPNTAPGQIELGVTSTAGVDVGQATGPVYYSLASTSTITLVAQVGYTTSTLTIDGDIHCIRVF